jgi:hypothetical protein
MTLCKIARDYIAAFKAKFGFAPIVTPLGNGYHVTTNTGDTVFTKRDLKFLTIALGRLNQ